MRNLQWSLESRTRKFFRGRSVLLPLLALVALVLFPWMYAISSWFALDDSQSTTTNLRTAPLQVPKRDSNNYPLVADYTSTRLDVGDIQPCSTSDEHYDAANAQWAAGKLSAPDLARFGTSSSPTELLVIQNLAKFHRTVGVCGPLIEIGVYKGWFVAALSSLLARDSEKVFAFDLYNMQEANVDNSGGGKVHVPLVQYFWMIVDQLHAMEKVITVQANSLDLSADAMLSMVGHKPRFISVDGGHFRIVTFHDLNIASRILHPEGVIAVDDYNNKGWKGVKIAVATFIAVWPEDLQPFLATDAKLYMCKKDQHQKFLSAAQKWFPGSKTCPGRSLNCTADDRVSLDLSSISEFVDQTNNANPGIFC